MIAENFWFFLMLFCLACNVFNNATLDEFLHFYVTSGNGILQGHFLKLERLNVSVSWY